MLPRFDVSSTHRVFLTIRSGASLVSEWDMVCGRRWLLYFQSSLFFIATLAGCVLWQLSAERYGAPRLLPAASARGLLACRRPAHPCLAARVGTSCCLCYPRSFVLRPRVPLTASPPPAGRRRLLYAGAMLCGLASVLASTAPSLWLYLVFRAASGAAMGGMGLAAYALAADVAGPSWRGSLGIFMNHFFSGGHRPRCAASARSGNTSRLELL